MSDNLEDLRRKEVELQKKQLFAQRVTAVSAAATALASTQAAASVERMRREASDAADAVAKNQREMREIQQAQLSAIQEQAQTAAREMEYQRQVLFLKESDDATKLDTYCEMAQSDYISIYTDAQDASLPEEVRADGTLTRTIQSLSRDKLKYDKLPMSGEVFRLQSEIQEVKTHITSEENDLKRHAYGFLAFLFLVIRGAMVLISLVLFFFCFGLVAMLLPDSPRSGEEQAQTTFRIVALLVCFGGGVLLLIAQDAKLFRPTKKIAAKKRLTILKERQASLETELKPHIDEAIKAADRAKKEAEENKQKAILGYNERWQTIMAEALIKNYFDQGLWIESGGFLRGLKAVLTEAQKPFPTSCRADVSKLQRNQIASAYQVFTELVAESMCRQIGSPHSAEMKDWFLKTLRGGPSALTTPFIK